MSEGHDFALQLAISLNVRHGCTIVRHGGVNVVEPSFVLEASLRKTGDRCEIH